MKKLVIFTGVLMVVAIALTTMTYAIPNFNYWQNDEAESYVRPCHQNRRQTSYAWYYLHLSSENQEIIDLLYIEYLSAYDFDAMTAEEKIETIKEIKSLLIDYMIEEEMITNRQP